MSVLAKYNPGINDDFWIKNPQFEVIKEFKEFKKKDKDSSMIMWAIAQLVEKEDNELVDLPEDERILVIESDVLHDKKIKLDKYTNLINAYKKLRYGVLERQLEELERKLEDRASFLRKETYNIDNAKILDGLIVSSDALIDKVMSLRKKLYESKANEGTVQGNRTESFLESM